MESWTEYAIEWTEDYFGNSYRSYTEFGRDLARAELMLRLYGFTPIPGHIVERVVTRTEWRGR